MCIYVCICVMGSTGSEPECRSSVLHAPSTYLHLCNTHTGVREIPSLYFFLQYSPCSLVLTKSHLPSSPLIALHRLMYTHRSAALFANTLILSGLRAVAAGSHGFMRINRTSEVILSLSHVEDFRAGRDAE